VAAGRAPQRRSAQLRTAGQTASVPLRDRQCLLAHLAATALLHTPGRYEVCTFSKPGHILAVLGYPMVSS
jgi:hypothetical protein